MYFQKIIQALWVYFISQIPPGKETNLGLFEQKKILLVRYGADHRIAGRTGRPVWGSTKNSGSRASPEKSPLNTDTTAYITSQQHGTLMRAREPYHTASQNWTEDSRSQQVPCDPCFISPAVSSFQLWVGKSDWWGPGHILVVPYLQGRLGTYLAFPVGSRLCLPQHS